MSEWISLATSVVGAIATIIVVIVTADKNNALQDERIKTLKDDVEKLSQKVEQHNNFGVRIAKLETRVEALEKEKRQ